jgi:hypothetical protein
MPTIEIENYEIQSKNCYARIAVGPCDWADLTDQERAIVEALGYKEPDMSFLKTIESGGWTEFPDDEYNGDNDIPSAVIGRIEVLARDGSTDYTYPLVNQGGMGDTPWDRIQWQRCDSEPGDRDTVAWRHV